MYRVAICEDEPVFAEEHERLCRSALDRLDIEHQIFRYENAARLLRDFSEGRRYDLFLLDILMDETDGVELAARIREQDAAAAIIFITSTPGYALRGYDVGALHYLMKPLDGGALERLIASDRQRRFRSPRFVFKSGRQSLNIPMDEIVCLETVGKRVAITLLGETLDCPGGLLELLKGRRQLVRCHKSFAVNMRNIRELTRTEALAVNGRTIPVSRTYFKDVQKAFLRQMGEPG
ncbi:MAG: LytTR family DNA-binding domain-containing protein [Oscillospiraceae bacterium]|nr:LytTR family DNA-binding domain-containing protein [Oscillospiraceae bacterium]